MNVSDIILLSSVAGLSARKIEDLVNQSKNETLEMVLKSLDRDRIRKVLKAVEEAIEKLGMVIITYWDDLYPEPLRAISSPPPVLYICGDGIGMLSREPKISIVGSRKCTHYGRNVARKLAEELATMNFVVVSGLAAGIDSAAHEGAALAGGTIGVLGNGVDVVYPSYNAKVYELVKEHGCVVSEFPPGTPPMKHHFPMRNRIISGLSLGVIVVEAGEKSGSLITARMAREQGREVFAVPGPVTSETSRGTNALIKNGAKLVQNVWDVIEEFPWLKLDSNRVGGNKRNEIELSEGEQRVLERIRLGDDTLDMLLTTTGMKMEEILTYLTFLEMKGLVKEAGGRYVAL